MSVSPRINGFTFAIHATDAGGALSVRHFEPGALLPRFAYLDAVVQGAVDSAWGTPAVADGRLPALALVTGLWWQARTTTLHGPVPARLRSLLAASGLAVAGLLVYYVYGSHAAWHYPRYLSPLAIPAVVGVGVLVSGAPATVRTAL